MKKNNSIYINILNKQKIVRIGRNERGLMKKAAEEAFYAAMDDGAKPEMPASIKFTARSANRRRRARPFRGERDAQSPPAKRIAIKSHGKRCKFEAVIYLTDDAGIKNVNLARRGIGKATDVLSFPSVEFGAEHTAPIVESDAAVAYKNSYSPAPIRDSNSYAAIGASHTANNGSHTAIGGSNADSAIGRIQLGDIMISAERASAQAGEYGHSLERELAFLAVHGVLHLLGFDHADGAGPEMQELAERVLSEIGLSRHTDGMSLSRHTDEPAVREGFRSGFIAVLGKPNVGKSTLINMICGGPFSIVSNKPQTTRRNARVILTAPDYQLVFEDTPGLHSPKSRLAEHMVRRAKAAIGESDAIILVADARDGRLSPQDEEALKTAAALKIPVMLIINKADLVKKETLLPFIGGAGAKYDFSCIIPLSAIKPEARDRVVKEALKLIPEGDPFYPEGMKTDQPEKRLIEDIVREKALRLLEQEVPHGIEAEVEVFRRRNSVLYDVGVILYCEREAHKKIIIGKNGEALKRIGVSARPDIERLLSCAVYLDLWVKVRKDWRNNDAMLRRMGYAD
jgi:GTP-binding protein Era/rRNA maturation RNase YbeY